MPNPANLSAEKARIRAQLKVKRAAIPSEQRIGNSKRINDKILALDAVQSAQTVFIYISFASEVETHGLIQQFLADGKQVAVPKILSPNKMLAARLSDWSRLEPKQLGILTPMDDDFHPGPFNLAITPGLGFTAAGQRIGFGAGYYDRWFASHDVKLKIAVAFDSQMVDHLPTEATDIPVDMIVTEHQMISMI